MARICVIGGSGFIGSYLIKLISKSHTIINIDKKCPSSIDENEYIQADITDYRKLESLFPQNIDLVILLAAEHADDVVPLSLYHAVNVDGTGNVIKIMEAKGVKRILFTSSVAVYGLNKDMPDECSPTDPFNQYGKSKLDAENLLRKWYEKDKSKNSLIIIRPTVIFGPGNKGNVYNLLTQICSGKFMMIGSGNNRKSMAYVENLAAFLAHCINLDLKSYQLYNYIDKPDISTKELVALAEVAVSKKVLPLKIPYWIGYSAAKFLDIILDIVKIKNPISAIRVQKFCATTQFRSATIDSTGFKAPFTLSDGLQITIKSIIEERSRGLLKDSNCKVVHVTG